MSDIKIEAQAKLDYEAHCREFFYYNCKNKEPRKKWENICDIAQQSWIKKAALNKREKKAQHVQILLTHTGSWRYVKHILPADLSVSIYPPSKSLAPEFDAMCKRFPNYEFRLAK